MLRPSHSVAGHVGLGRHGEGQYVAAEPSAYPLLTASVGGSWSGCSDSPLAFRTEWQTAPRKVAFCLVSSLYPGPNLTLQASLVQGSELGEGG